MPIVCVRIVVSTPKYSRLEPAIIQSLMHDAGIGHLNEMQTLGIPRIRSGSNLLIVAPTGSGKTEAALLPVLQGLSSGTEAGIRALYITPLRALNRDMIDRVQRLVSSTGLSAAVRHGDTPLKILAAPLEKQYESRFECPRPIEKDFEPARAFYIPPEAAAGLSAIDDPLDESRSTLVFVTAPPLAELLSSRLSMLRQDVAVHHGSLPREERERVEAGFKGGDIKGLVSTSTLELGIDIGTVDQVVQYNSPRQVTSLIQRVGRSGHKLDRTSRGLGQLVARSSDPLDEGRDLPRRVVLDDLIDRPDVDPELEGGRRHEPFDVSAFESGLDALPFLAGEGAVVDGDVLSEHREARTEELGQGAGVHEDERGAALVERIVDRGEPGCRLRGDVEVSGGLEILVDRAGPLDAVFVLLLEGSHQDFERVLTAEEGRDGSRMADRRGEPDTLEATGDRTQAFESDGELDSSAIRRELMDFVDDDVFGVLQMTLHDLPRQNCLERLGSRNEDVRRSRGLFPPFGRRSVAMAHRSRQTRTRYEVVNPINHVAVERSQWSNVKGANSRPRTG